MNMEKREIMDITHVSLLMQKKQYSMALKYMNTSSMSRLSTHSTKIQYYKALCYTNLKIYDTALNLFDFVLSSKLGFIYVYQCKMIRGYIYTITEKLRLAELEFLDLIKNGYESTRVYAAVGHVAYVQGKASQAVHLVQKALKLNPDSPTALNSMSYILAENNVKLDLALQYIGKALTKYPENPSYLDTLGLVFCRLGKFKDARRVLNKARRLSNDPVILKHYKLAEEKKKI